MILVDFYFAPFFLSPWLMYFFRRSFLSQDLYPLVTGILARRWNRRTAAASFIFSPQTVPGLFLPMHPHLSSFFFSVPESSLNQITDLFFTFSLWRFLRFFLFQTLFSSFGSSHVFHAKSPPSPVLCFFQFRPADAVFLFGTCFFRTRFSLASFDADVLFSFWVFTSLASC